MSATPPGWPFFAPSASDRVAAALALADLRPGEHLVDLGCGDGQVLAAAARRGARVTGIECDPELAAQARATLETVGSGEVVEADLFAPEAFAGIEPPDIVFCYLSPATLQRLTARLEVLPAGTRLVTVDFAVPGLVPDERRDGTHLYRLPVRPRRLQPGRAGWPCAGTLCVMPPSVESLTCLAAVHAGGPAELSLRGELRRHASVVAGLDAARRGETVAVDVCWRPEAPGTVAHGYVLVGDLPPHLVVVLFAHDGQGQWDLSEAGCTALLSRLRTRALPPPRSVEDLMGVLT